jgi:hypothetical protein
MKTFGYILLAPAIWLLIMRIEAGVFPKQAGDKEYMGAFVFIATVITSGIYGILIILGVIK